MMFSIKPTQRIRNCYSLIPLNCREVTSASFLSPLSNDSIPDLDSHLISVVKTLSWEVDGNTVRLTVWVNRCVWLCEPGQGGSRLTLSRRETTWLAYICWLLSYKPTNPASHWFDEEIYFWIYYQISLSLLSGFSLIRRLKCRRKGFCLAKLYFQPSSSAR